MIANEDGVSFWGDGDVLELDRGADWASQVALVIKNLSANAGDVGSIPGSGLEVFVGGRRETLVSLAFCRGP